MVEKKTRNWTFIVYPESAPRNWREILDEQHVRWVESPKHDKDVNPDGEIKKAHYHILLAFDGPMSSKTPADIAKSLNSPIPKAVGSARGLVRYMIHMDNPEKYQYDINEIVGHSGADVQEYFEMTATSKLTTLKEIVRYIHDEQIDNFDDFLQISIDKSDDWFSIATSHNTLAINKQLDAIWHKKHWHKK